MAISYAQNSRYTSTEKRPKVSNTNPTFQVPLDYSDPSGPEAAIALIKVPAEISMGQGGYRGPVLINPGKPPFGAAQFHGSLTHLSQVVLEVVV